MISYPGDIIERFGRYEAVEDLGQVGVAQLWRAWDPFLQRFVVIAALAALDPAEMIEGMRKLDDALGRWTAGRYRQAAQVVDFGSGAEGGPPFLVLPLAEAEEGVGEGAFTEPEDGARADEAAAAERQRAAVIPGGGRRKGPLLLATAGAALLLVGILLGYFVRPAAGPQGTPPGLSGRQAALSETPVASGPRVARSVPTLAAGAEAGGADRSTGRPQQVSSATAQPGEEARVGETEEHADSAGSTPRVAAPVEIGKADRDRLVEDWLTEFCDDAEDEHLQRVGEAVTCSWGSVVATGPGEALDVEFDHIMRATADDSEAVVRRQARLACSVDDCDLKGRVVEAAAEVPRQTAAAAPAVRFQPSGRTIRLGAGESQQFSAKAPGGKGVTYEWRLDGESVGDGPRHTVRADDLGADGRILVAKVADATGAAVGLKRWAIALKPSGAARRVSIAAPRRDVLPGEVVKLTAQIGEGEAETNEGLECEWAVDGRAMQRYCREFEWTVPDDHGPGAATISLKVRAPGGTWDTRQVVFAVGEREVAVEAPDSPGAQQAGEKAVRETERPTTVGRPATPVGKEKRPATPVAEKRPVTPVAEKRPATPVVEKRPATPVAEKRPATPVAEKLPVTPVAEKRPVTPVAEKGPATPVVRSTATVVPATSEKGQVRQAIAGYYQGYEEKLRKNPRTREADFSYEVTSLAGKGGRWVAVVERTVGVPGQPVFTNADTLAIERDKGSWSVKPKK